MRIHPANPLAVQLLALNHTHHFLMLGDLRLRQSLEQSKDLLTIAQRPARQLTDDEGMGHHLTVFQEGPKPGSVPPSLASRWALSRAINASSPMRTSAVFVVTPVNRAARRRRDGSILRVVLIRMHYDA